MVPTRRKIRGDCAASPTAQTVTVRGGSVTLPFTGGRQQHATKGAPR